MVDPRPPAVAPLALPIDAFLAEIGAALVCGPSVIIKAEPGAGKTTRVPNALLGVVPGRIVVLEPRRLAARLSAERVAAERGEAIGRTVGYQIRFETRSSAETRLHFVTEGVFLRQALAAPTLPGIGVVVIDEFHERHIHTDLALAIVKQLQCGPRPDLRLVVMSATLEAEALAAYLPDARVFVVPGRAFPVDIEYLAVSDAAPVEDTVAAGVGRLLADPRCPGDILVFLTGIQEIRRCAGRLAGLAGAGIDVLPLAADLPHRDQARVFEPSGRRKVILATNVAETSLTLPGVTGVVDTGRAKIAGHAAWSGMPTLDVKRVSQASCIQRSGRAGRVARGVACRLYSEADYRGRAPFGVPDIRRLDLAETYLDVLALADALGAPATDLALALPWLEAPEAKATQSARTLLGHLGALDERGALTPLGRLLAAVPLHPRLAAIVVKGQALGIPEAALGAACLISERMLLASGVAAVARDDSDVGFQLAALVRLAGGLQLASRALEGAVDQGKAKRIQALYTALASRLRIGPLGRAAGVEEAALASCLLAGFPDRVAKRRPDAPGGSGGKPLYNFCLGRGGVMGEGSAVRDAEVLLALDASETQSRSADRGTVIYVAARITPEALLDSPAAGLLASGTAAVWAEAAERVDVLERITYGQLVIVESRDRVRAEHAGAIEELLREKLAERWPKPFDDSGDLDSYHARAQVLLALTPDLPLPRFDGEMLELLQAAICEGKRSFKEIQARSLLSYIEDQLPYELRAALAERAPAELRLANGRCLKLTYEAGRPPYIGGYIQDFYGVRASPLLPGGASVTLHLAAPNRRPVQVTSDLAGFWARSYPPLRAELGRKYPKHYWPEQPEAAEPHLFKARTGRR